MSTETEEEGRIGSARDEAEDRSDKSGTVIDIEFNC